MNIHCKSVALTGALLFGVSATTAPSAEEILTVALPGQAPQVASSFNRQRPIFEPNVGQTDAQVEFLARGPGYQLFLSATDAVMVLNCPAADETPKSRTAEGGRQGSAASWDGFEVCENRKFPELSNTIESGAGAPQSKTLTRSPGPVECPPGFGVRQPSAAQRILAVFERPRIIPRDASLCPTEGYGGQPGSEIPGTATWKSMNESYNCSNKEHRTADRPSDELILPDWSGQVTRAPRMPMDQWLEYCRSHLSQLRQRPGYAQRRRRNGIPVEFAL